MQIAQNYLNASGTGKKNVGKSPDIVKRVYSCNEGSAGLFVDGSLMACLMV